MLLLLALACVDYAIKDDTTDLTGPGATTDEGPGGPGGPGGPAGPGGPGGPGGDTDTAPPEDIDTGGPGSPGGPGGPGTTEPTDTETTSPEDTDAPPPGSSADNPREGLPGDWAITELMINPSAVSDSEGEWVEILNLTDEWLTLEGHFLADDNIDRGLITADIPADLVVRPGSYAVICAAVDASLNGGVDCSGGVEYTTFGDGFALANGGDEAVLLTPDGETLDAVAYSDGFAPTAASTGVAATYATPEGNDDLSRWCEQSSTLSGGDAGSPGADNDPC